MIDIDEWMYWEFVTDQELDGEYYIEFFDVYYGEVWFEELLV